MSTKQLTAPAENICVSETDSGMITVRFAFKCPNCHRTHRRKEICLAGRLFQFVGYKLDCGYVQVLMPRPA